MYVLLLFFLALNNNIYAIEQISADAVAPEDLVVKDPEAMGTDPDVDLLNAGGMFIDDKLSRYCIPKFSGELKEKYQEWAKIYKGLDNNWENKNLKFFKEKTNFDSSGIENAFNYLVKNGADKKKLSEQINEAIKRATLGLDINKIKNNALAEEILSSRERITLMALRTKMRAKLRNIIDINDSSVVKAFNACVSGTLGENADFKADPQSGVHELDCNAYAAERWKDEDVVRLEFVLDARKYLEKLREDGKGDLNYDELMKDDPAKKNEILSNYLNHYRSVIKLAADDLAVIPSKYTLNANSEKFFKDNQAELNKLLQDIDKQIALPQKTLENFDLGGISTKFHKMLFISVEKADVNPAEFKVKQKWINKIAENCETFKKRILSQSKRTNNDQVRKTPVKQTQKAFRPLKPSTPARGAVRY